MIDQSLPRSGARSVPVKACRTNYNTTGLYLPARRREEHNYLRALFYRHSSVAVVRTIPRCSYKPLDLLNLWGALRTRYKNKNLCFNRQPCSIPVEL